ncbi:hypothetical protein LTR95_014993, partial [Oleoguttula sp. CCFEE 5521]
RAVFASGALVGGEQPQQNGDTNAARLGSLSMSPRGSTGTLIAASMGSRTAEAASGNVSENASIAQRESLRSGAVRSPSPVQEHRD